MKREIVYVPKANPKERAKDIVDIFIGLIPFGEENAINRKVLTQTCITIGLIDKEHKDADRAMRDIMHKAKIDYAICNNGKGYFRPLPKDVHTLKICLEKERSRMISINSSFKTLERLYEDYINGRIK